jgi:hypothetical protein
MTYSNSFYSYRLVNHFNIRFEFLALRVLRQLKYHTLVMIVSDPESIPGSIHPFWSWLLVIL